MKKINYAAMLVISLTILLSCAPTSGGDAEIPFLLDFAGSSADGTRSLSRGSISEAENWTRSEAVYVANAPLVTGFIDSNGTVSNGGTESKPIFDDSIATYTITIIGNNITYEGRIHKDGDSTDESGYFTLVYDVGADSFDFSQYLILEDPDLIIEESDEEEAGTSTSNSGDGDDIWVCYSTIEDAAWNGSAYIGTTEKFFLSFEYEEGSTALDAHASVGRARVGSQYVLGEFYMGDDYSGFAVYDDSIHLFGMIDDGESTGYTSGSTQFMRDAGWDPTDLAKAQDFISYMNPTSGFDALWTPGPLGMEFGFVLDKTTDEYSEVLDVPWLP